MAALTPDLTTATPRLSYFHIAGPSTREYLSDDLQQFMSATSSYFELRNKFRQTVAAPTRNVTTEKAQRLQIRYYPIQTDDTSNTHRVRFSINVGDSWVLDMGSTYFDIKGTLDRGPSFKPYGGTAYNPLAPKESVFNFLYNGSNSKNYFGVQMSTLYKNENKSSPTESQDEFKKITSTYPNPNVSTDISIPEIVIPKAHKDDFSGVARVAKTKFMLSHGAYVQPSGLSGAQTLDYKTYVLSSDGSNYEGLVALEDYSESLKYPDTIYVPPIEKNEDISFGITKGMRPNYIGFRDNFINLLYHDSGVCSGTLNSERSGMNVVVALQDRNTELSYQYMLADMMSRHHYFALWNQAVDQYDHDVRVLNNDGYEESVSSYAFAPSALGYQWGGDLYASSTLNLYETQNDGQMNTGLKIDNVNAAIGLGNVQGFEININASMKRNFIMSNLSEYLPDKYKVSVDDTVSTLDRRSYLYMNKRIPLSNIVDLFTNIGGRWSVDQLDSVNPFNHHRNWGLKYRSQLLGNSRYCNFHIQVPQKYFAIKNLLLLPGTYTYEWVLRKDPNMILQSSLGNDLRLDGASITFNEVNLMASFMPMDHNTSNQLELMMRNATNDQTFMDYLGAKNALYSIPSNSTQITINIPARTWEGMRGWSFTRLKSSETPQQGAQYDTGFRYSGSIPYLDGTFYLNHTFRNMSVLFDTSINWPGNDRLLSPNMFEIKRQPESDAEGYTMSQSNITKDWWLIQMATNYNYVYNGYRFWPDRHYFHYDFLRNFDPMTIQSPNFSDNNIFNLITNNLSSQDNVRNNSGFIAPRSESIYGGRQGHAWPANWPYPLIGEDCIDKSSILQYKKFLCDNYLWTIPFSSDFMYMGELTDLGQNPMYTNNSHSMVINFEVDPMEEDTYLYMLYGVFDAVRVNQPERNVLAMAYFRTPFATGNAV